MKKECLKRIKKLQEVLVEKDLDAFIVDDLTNLLYLTGQQLSLGRLVVTPKAARLIIDSRYYESCKKQSPIPVVLHEPHVLEKLLEQKQFSNIKAIGFDAETTSFKQHRDLQVLLKKVDRKIKLAPLNNPVKQLRSIKDDTEIAILKKAANLGSEGFHFVCSLLKAGITEIEVANELEIFWKRKGSKGLAFESIIAFGPNSSMPHYRPQDVKLKKGQPVLIDIGVNLDDYNSDMTRVVFFGKPQPKMVEIYNIVLEAQKAALALCKPGTLISDLDKAARDLITSRGYGKNFTHSLGHGVGLEIHEEPTLRAQPTKQRLVPGMIITIEPGIYLSDIGGVRIEDTVAITEKGHINLSSPSKELLVIK